MRDDHHVAGPVVAVFVVGRGQLLGDPAARSYRSRTDSPPGGSRVGVGHPAAGETGEGRVYRHRRGALEDAEAALPQPAVGENGQAEHAGERRGGLQRAAQVADVQGADGVAADGAADSAACRRPRLVSSARSLWPWARPSAFQVLSPCLTR